MVTAKGSYLVDFAAFISGSLFTTDYLAEAIKADPAYLAVDTASLRSALEAIAGAFPQSHNTNESQTEDDFIWPVLSALGWTASLRQQNLTVGGREDVPDGLLFADAGSKAAANAQDDQWKRYSHGLAVVESKRWARPLDRASGRGEATAPSTQMLRYLRRIDDLTGGDLRWGILTNGKKWRLYWAGARSVSEEFLEIDLSRVLALDGSDDLFADDAVRDHWLRVFAAMFRRDAFMRTGMENRTFHERSRAAAEFYEERVAANLSRLVFERVFPDLAGAIARAAPQAPLEDVRQASLVLLYRLLFLLYAEDRDLLPVGEKRYDDYALRHQRNEVGQRISEGDGFSASAGKIWAHVADLARIIDKGDASVGIPPYNGGLFASDATPLLDTIRIPDSVMAPALDALSYERSSGEPRYINYRDLSVQQLGSIYERLLEFEIVRDEAGTLAVRPNQFARKNSGSYYTPDDLVGLILDQTLEPLIAERLDDFRSGLERLGPEEPLDQQAGDLHEVDPAESILKLRICDPAMGSGHFLVSLVDTLADHVLDAMAEAHALAAEHAPQLEYISPLANKIEEIRRTILKNAKVAGWTLDPAQLDDRHIVRRMVLKRCVYGVDKNPMAVELAKVALWLHTFTVGAPLSFIDHHLRAGDSLFGLWVRDAIDKAGAQGGELLHIGPLREAAASAAAMGIIERLTDAEIAQAHQSAATWYGVQSQIAPLDSFVSFLHALDWLDLKQPVEKAAVRALLDGQFGNPVEIMLGRQEPVTKTTISRVGEDRMKKQRFDTAQLLDAAERILKAARSLIEEERFLNWEIAFPGVWEAWSEQDRSGGFDAVVGNPPWDRIKLQQVEWFAARRPEIARAQRASDRGKLIAKLQTDGDPLWEQYGHADKRSADTARIARDSGNYPLLSRGDINLYSLFVERAHALVKPGGMVGLLTPSGIASDLSASAFFRKIASGGHLKALYDFENRRTRYALEPFFPDVDSRFKFCAMIGSPTRQFDSAHCGFFLQSTSELGDTSRVFNMPSSEFVRVNPNTGTAPIFRSARDAEIITRIYHTVPVLVEHSGSATKRSWDVTYSTMFHMTNDSHLFRTPQELQHDGWYSVGRNRWRKGQEESVPLYVGRMFQQFDHRAAGVGANDGNLHNPALSDRTSLMDKCDPNFLTAPQFWVSWDAVRPKREWSLAFRDIARPTDARTIIAAILPGAAYGNKAPLLLTESAYDATLLLGNLNSFVLDFVARSKIQSTNANWYIVEQLPILPPSAYDRRFGEKTAREIVLRDVLSLSYTASDLSGYAKAMGVIGADGQVKAPTIWNDEERMQKRARLDALYFHLYGVSADQADYILSQFPIVFRQDQEEFGHYLTRDLILNHMNALSAGDTEAVIQFQRLNPTAKKPGAVS